VERFVASGSTRDARALLKAAADGESLAFFPEGTFVAEAGLRRFRLGAFAAAVKGDLPVVPVVIRGSRRLLPSDAFLPTRGPLRVDVLAPLATPESDHVSSKDLAALARQRILTVLDEPDLGQIDAA
jgi:1-acyl-sn-glycerol-3-phosphate acyltransferase